MCVCVCFIFQQEIYVGPGYLKNGKPFFCGGWGCGGGGGGGGGAVYRFQIYYTAFLWKRPSAR